MSNQIEADEIYGWTEIEPEFDHQRQTFRRRRDDLVIAVERDGMSCYNVVTLSDNQVTDWVVEGAGPYLAAGTAREWMEHNNQTEDDEMREWTETEPGVGPGVVGDLLIGELDSWHVGICEVKKDDDDLLVCGEDGRVVERVDTDVWTTSTLFEGIEAKDLAKIADMINSAIASEEDEL